MVIARRTRASAKSGDRVVQRDVVVVEVVELHEPAAAGEGRVGRRLLLETGVDLVFVEAAPEKHRDRPSCCRARSGTRSDRSARAAPGSAGCARARSIPGSSTTRTGRARRRAATGCPWPSGSSGSRNGAPAESGERTPSGETRRARENRTRNRLVSRASTEAISSKSGLKTCAGTFGSAIFRIVKTASAAVTGLPSSQTASGRIAIVYSRPSADASMDSAMPGASRSLESKSNRLRCTYWRTCASGELDWSTAFSVVGSPVSRRRRTPPSTAGPSPDSSRNPSAGGPVGRSAGVETAGGAAGCASSRPPQDAAASAIPRRAAPRARFMLSRL